MKRIQSMNRKILTIFLLTAVMLLSVSAVALGAPTQQDEDAALMAFGGNGDDLAHPLGTKQRALRQQALQQVVQGVVAADGVQRLASGQFVEVQAVDEDLIWTVLAEFGTKRHETHGGARGPLHNAIPQPDRSVDNTTIWEPDFNEAYYEELLYSQAPGVNSMANYYIEQSSNLYTVNGDVTDWVLFPLTLHAMATTPVAVLSVRQPGYLSATRSMSGIAQHATAACRRLRSTTI
jgi:immune inhibitor A